jgi:hypothetical protein
MFINFLVHILSKYHTIKNNTAKLTLFIMQALLTKLIVIYREIFAAWGELTLLRIIPQHVL